MDEQQPFFIVGSPRSGTKLLRDLLRSHPHLAIPWETHFIVRFYQLYGNPQTDAEAINIVQAISKTIHFKRWQISIQFKNFAHFRNYGQIIHELYSLYAQKEGKQRWGDKTPRYVLNIPILYKIFPNCKIIHIIRDGRDVALSGLGLKYCPNNIPCAALSWKKFVLAGRQGAQSIPSHQYLEVFYEDLLKNPSTVMKKICEFIGEPFTEEVTIASEQKIKTPHIIKKTPIHASNIAKWKTKMTSYQLKLFNTIAGDLLASLGYETTEEKAYISPIHWTWFWFHDKFFKVINTLGRPKEIIQNYLYYFLIDLKTKLKKSKS